MFRMLSVLVAVAIMALLWLTVVNGLMGGDEECPPAGGGGTTTTAVSVPEQLKGVVRGAC